MYGMYWSMKAIYDFMMSSSEENLQASHDYYFLFAKMQFFSPFMITAASLTFSDGSWWMTGGMKKDTASDLHSKPSTKTTFFDKVIKRSKCWLRIFEAEYDCTAILYRGVWGFTGKSFQWKLNPCNKDSVPCNENRFFPVRIDLQGVPLILKFWFHEYWNRKH